MKHTQAPLRSLSAVATLALLITACSPKGDAPGAAPPPAPKVRVQTIQPQNATISTELPGRTLAFQEAEVRPQVSGILKSRLFTEGMDIKAGTTLYQIDPATYQAALSSAQAALDKANANLVTAEARSKRFEALAEGNAVSQQERDDAKAALLQARADVAATKAALQNAQIQLNYTRVYAPISGRISRSSVTAGALVQANQAQALARIVQLDPLYVDLTQSTTELLKLRQQVASGQLKSTGQGKVAVKLMLEDGTEHPQEGSLQFSEATVDPTTGTVTLRAIVPNPKRALLPGMYVRARLATGVRESAILVPQKALARDNTGAAVVYLLGADNTVERRPVKTAQAVGDQWVISEGLKEGEVLIVEGLQKVKPGQPAEVIKE